MGSFLEPITTGDDRLVVFMVDGTKNLLEDFAHIFKDALEQIVVSKTP